MSTIIKTARMQEDSTTGSSCNNEATPERLSTHMQSKRTSYKEDLPASLSESNRKSRDFARTALGSKYSQELENGAASRAQALEIEERQPTEKWQRLQAAHEATVAALTKRLKAAEEEVETLREYLCTYDDASPEEIGSALKGINDRIEGTARENANYWLFDRPPGGSAPSLVANNDHIQILEYVLGQRFVSQLSNVSPKEGFALFFVQSAFQACIVGRVRSVIQQFSPVGVEWGIDDRLYELSQAIRHGESQPVYGRWRSMTHQYLRLAHNGDAESSSIEQQLQLGIGHCYLVAVLLLRSRCPDYDTFSAMFKAPFHEILVHATKLAFLLRERVVSADYKPLAPPRLSWGKTGGFDKLSMVTSDPESLPPHGSEVLFAVRLGLICVSKPGRERKEGSRTAIFRQAEVVTAHCLHEAMCEGDDDRVVTRLKVPEQSSRRSKGGAKQDLDRFRIPLNVEPSKVN